MRKRSVIFVFVGMMSSTAFASYATDEVIVCNKKATADVNISGSAAILCSAVMIP